MSKLLSEISDELLRKIMAFERILQERTMEYSYEMYPWEDAETMERNYTGKFSMQWQGVMVNLEISEFRTLISAEGIENEWIVKSTDYLALTELLYVVSDFTYAGISLNQEYCLEDEIELNLVYHIPVVEEHCCTAEGYAEMLLDIFTLFRAEAYLFAQQFEVITG